MHDTILMQKSIHAYISVNQRTSLNLNDSN